MNEEVKKITDLFNSKQEEIKTALADKASVKEIETLKGELKTIADSLKAIESKEAEVKMEDINKVKSDFQKQIDEVSVSISKFNQNLPSKKRTLYDAIKGAIESPEYKDFEARGFGGNSKEITLDVKDVTIGGYTGDIAISKLGTTEVTYVPPKRWDIRQIIKTASSEKDTIYHMVESGYVDGSGFLAENAETGESTFALTETKTDSCRLGTHINVSKKALRNLNYLINHLTNRIGEELVEALNDSVINGDGTGNTINGLINNATAFTAGSFANSVTEANQADVIAVAMTRLAQVTNLRCDAIFMNPVDVRKMGLIKSTTGEYLVPTNGLKGMVTMDGMGNKYIDGVRIYETFHITADNYLIADLSANSVELFEVQAITMSASDSHEDNFTKNLITYNFEMDVILPIYKTFAFMTGDFTTDIAAIQAAT